ncbi:hypothetical protein MASR2M8_03610 [Opitutaceae bacterium]
MNRLQEGIGRWLKRFCGLVCLVGVGLAQAQEDEVLTFPGGGTIRAYAQHGEQHFYGTRDGLWRRSDHHEISETERVWGAPRQTVDSLAVLGDRIVFSGGLSLYSGPVDDPGQWAALPRDRFTVPVNGSWSRVAVIASRFVARGSGVFYSSADGQRWAPLATGGRSVLAVGGDGYRLWVLTREPATEPGFRLGRTEDGETWSWSNPLPATGFTPDGGSFVVLNGDTAVLAGHHAEPGQTIGLSKAIMTYRWSEDSPIVWQVVQYPNPAAGGGGSLIELAQTMGTAWARLPDEGLVASVSGFDWIRVAEKPLGANGYWFVGGSQNGDALVLAANGGAHMSIYEDQVDSAGRMGAAEVAWQNVRRGPDPVTPPPAVAVAANAAGPAVRPQPAATPAPSPAPVPAPAPAAPPVASATVSSTPGFEPLRKGLRDFLARPAGPESPRELLTLRLLAFTQPGVENDATYRALLREAAIHAHAFVPPANAPDAVAAVQAVENHLASLLIELAASNPGWAIEQYYTLAVRRRQSPELQGIVPVFVGLPKPDLEANDAAALIKQLNRGLVTAPAVPARRAVTLPPAVSAAARGWHFRVDDAAADGDIPGLIELLDGLALAWRANALRAKAKPPEGFTFMTVFGTPYTSR